MDDDWKRYPPNTDFVYMAKKAGKFRVVLFRRLSDNLCRVIVSDTRAGPIVGSMHVHDNQDVNKLDLLTAISVFHHFVEKYRG